MPGLLEQMARSLQEGYEQWYHVRCARLIPDPVIEVIYAFSARDHSGYCSDPDEFFEHEEDTRVLFLPASEPWDLDADTPSAAAAAGAAASRSFAQRRASSGSLSRRFGAVGTCSRREFDLRAALAGKQGIRACGLARPGSPGRRE
jgi:hypothetical protein